MTRTSTPWTTAAYAVAVAASLAFGAAQALAAPGEARGEKRCDSICVFQCGAPGGREIVRGGPCICCLP